MQTPATLSKEIDLLIVHYVKIEKNKELRLLEKRHHLLPLYADIGAVISWTSMAAESNAEPSPEENPRFRLAALVSGAQKYPILRQLLPSRAADAMNCPECGGSALSMGDKVELQCGICCGP